MENKKEYRYQWSSKLDNGEIILVRSDNKEDLILDIEWAKSQTRGEKPLESHPEASETPEWMEEEKTLNDKFAGKTLDEIPEVDDSYCQVHEVKMKERIGKNGVFYSHSKGEYPDLKWCSGKGFKE